MPSFQEHALGIGLQIYNTPKTYSNSELEDLGLHKRF